MPENLMKYAKRTRKEGESWQDALDRSREELFGENTKELKLHAKMKKPKKSDGKVSNNRADYKNQHEWFNRHRKK